MMEAKRGRRKEERRGEGKELKEWKREEGMRRKK